MFYLKTEIEGKVREVEIHDDEIFTICNDCGREFNAGVDVLKHFMDNEYFDFAGSSINCPECARKRAGVIYEN